MANDVTRYNDRNGRRDLSLFDDFFDSMLGAWGSYSAKVPAVDVEETPENYLVKAELPGFSEDDVKISIDKHVLHISGEINENEKEKDGRKFLIRERRHESFERSFSLPDGIDELLRCPSGRYVHSLAEGVLYIGLEVSEFEVIPDASPLDAEIDVAVRIGLATCVRSVHVNLRDAVTSGNRPDLGGDVIQWYDILSSTE